MTLLELTLETAINEAGEFKDVRLSKEDAEYLLSMLKKQEAGCGKDKNEPLKISRDWVDEYHGYVAACPECDCFWIMYRDEDMKFCPGCGKEVKWK